MKTTPLATLLSEKQIGHLELGSARMALLDIEAGFWGIRRQLETIIGTEGTASVLQQAGANGGASFARSFFSSNTIDPPGAFTACLHAYQTAGFGQFDITEIDWPNFHVHIEAKNTVEAWMTQQHNQHPTAPVCAYTAGVLVGFINVLLKRQDVVCIEKTCQGRGDDTCHFELLHASTAENQHIVAFTHDPGLGRQVNLLELLFDRMPMGIAVFDRNSCLARHNPTWAEFIDKYTPSSIEDVQPGVTLSDLAPGADAFFQPIFERVLAGEVVQIDGFKSVSGGITSYWDVVFSPLIENGEITGILDVTADATKRTIAEQELQNTLTNLEQLVTERTREITTLLEISQDITGTLDISQLLEKILDALGTVVPYSGASVMTIEQDELIIQAYHGPIPQAQVAGLHFPFQQSRANFAVMQSRKPVIISDTRANTPLAHAFQTTAGSQIDSTFGYIRSWMGIPLIVRREIIGMLSLDHEEPNYYTSESASLAMAFANQAAIGIENARLYQEEQQQRQSADRRRKVAESLRETLAALNSSQSLDELLHSIVNQANELIGGNVCLLHQINYETNFVTIQASCCLPPSLRLTRGFPLYSSNRSDTHILEQKPIWISDYAALPAPSAETLAAMDPTVRAWREQINQLYRAWLAVPLVIHNSVYGSLAFYFSTPRDFTEEDINLATTYANQAALAIENANLRLQAEQAAVLGERNRLARDLHDAVTQTLFSSSLIADVLPKIWARSPENGRHQLEELRQLTKGALSEMRTLLLELRPAALIDTSLDDLISHQVNAFKARTRIQAIFAHNCPQNPPPDVKEMFYRITQEALNNISKHADAATVKIKLECLPGRTTLSIQDDGIGFDPEALATEGLGMGIMQERAASVGARMTINSKIHFGTQIHIVWEAPEE